MRERLPLPYVHYPKHYGTFLAFSASTHSRPFLCECSITAIKHYIELRKQYYENIQKTSNSRLHALDARYLPESVRKISLKHKDDLLSHLKFRKAICHRCNLVPPTLRYCHEMYGVTFIQHFGWYVEQAYLRFGILQPTLQCLPGITPEEYVNDLIAIRKASSESASAHKWFIEQDQHLINHLVDPKSFPLPEQSSDEEIATRQQLLSETSLKFRQAKRVLSKKIENIVRQEFGFRKVGEHWTSETIVFNIVNFLFPKRKILHHFRPDWLHGMELDIFIPDLNLAIEYQGQQHYHPVRAWGGKQALHMLQARDRKKAKICYDRMIKLITIAYTEPLTVEYIESRITN